MATICHRSVSYPLDHRLHQFPGINEIFVNLLILASGLDFVYFNRSTCLGQVRFEIMNSRVTSECRFAKHIIQRISRGILKVFEGPKIGSDFEKLIIREINRVHQIRLETYFLRFALFSSTTKKTKKHKKNFCSEQVDKSIVDLGGSLHFKFAFCYFQLSDGISMFVCTQVLTDCSCVKPHT